MTISATDFHLAHANVARMRGSYDDSIMEGFVARLDPLNEIADDSPGFIWRYSEDEGDTSVIDAFGDPQILFNMSVWESVDALEDYAYRSDHIEAVRKRMEWFERPTKSPFVLWWIPVGHTPNVVEAKMRLELLWQIGPTDKAFTFRQRFSPT